VAGRPPSPALADALAGRSDALGDLGQIPEAAEDARRALAVAHEVGHPFGEAVALLDLALAAAAAGDVGDAVRLARQASQVRGDMPASITRACSVWLTEVLIQADDFAAAERLCADGLAAFRDAGDLVTLPTLLARMALLELRAGRGEDAEAHLREALQLALRTGIWFAVYLDCCGHLCAATGRQAEAVTLWAAYAALLPREQDWPGDARLRQEPLRAAQRVLGPGQARAAEERGMAMGWATATEYALMLTGPGPQQPQAPGPGKLSARERELVTLVAQGATNAQIAAQLAISVRTVGTHLDRIRDKTGCRRRADLTRLALTAGLV
jgi:DNA-binding CsgD family transcriptional regulator